MVVFQDSLSWQMISMPLKGDNTWTAWVCAATWQA
jgi:hypothetical protein